MWFQTFGGNKGNRINLSTATASSSSVLLSSVRAERLAREEHRRREVAATMIQRVWRTRSVGAKARAEVLDRLEREGEGSGSGSSSASESQALGRRAGEVVGMWKLAAGSERDGKRARAITERFLKEGMAVDPGTGGPALLSSLSTSEEGIAVLCLLSIRVLEAVVLDPRQAVLSRTTAQSAVFLSSLETIFSAASYAILPPDRAAQMRSALVGYVGRQGWVEKLVEALEKLVAASVGGSVFELIELVPLTEQPPKKKHPHLQPLVRLLTAPLGLGPPAETIPLLPPLINHLLAVPSLPSVLPLQSLTHISSSLPLFSTLLPYAAANPNVLSHGRLRTEVGKTYFLANLATFGITGGMLARFGSSGAALWIAAVGTVLSQVAEGWGRWAEGVVEEPEDEDVVMGEVEEDGEASQARLANHRIAFTAPIASSSKQALPPPREMPRQTRSPLPTNISSKLRLFASSQHLATFVDLVVAPKSGSDDLLARFAEYGLALLNAFRGSARWEGILDALLDGPKGSALVRRLWRGAVRGKWQGSDDKESWEAFTTNPGSKPLLFLTSLYNHYLLLSPDDEFFNATNPLGLDEVLELARVWRDLAFWGYMVGVRAREDEEGMGTEEDRAAFTRGVTRVAERNARRKFAPEEFWVMSNQMDLKGFVAAAVFDDAELAEPVDEVNPTAAPGEVPHYIRSRQRWTKRQMAYISPRLGLLNNLPMAVPFQTRLEAFRQFVEADRDRLDLDRRGHRSGRIKAKIHRTSLAEDGFNQLNDYGPALKKAIYITFYNEFGEREEGIDGGGLFKEFLTNLTKEVFDTNRGLWLATDQNQLYPNPHSYAKEPHQLAWYGFIGRILGKAIYEGILVDASFANFFLAKWMGRQPSLDDLNSLDKELYKGLTILKNYPKPEDLALNFTVTESEFGELKTVDLVPGGSDVAVTTENRSEYIQLVCKYKMDRQIAPQCRAFFNGLADIIDPKWLRMFDQQELQQLIGGEETIIDLEDLRRHSNITGFPSDKTMKMFWNVVQGFNQSQRQALLRFVTSCSRPPLLGFANLNPMFGIRYGGDDTSRLPSASSCFNLLKLPGYSDEPTLRSKLLQAIMSGAGFDLS